MPHAQTKGVLATQSMVQWEAMKIRAKSLNRSRTAHWDSAIFLAGLDSADGTVNSVNSSVEALVLQSAGIAIDTNQVPSLFASFPIGNFVYRKQALNAFKAYVMTP